jgi:TRAP-type C4-dicarboxylate transport system permease small subunit
MTNTYTKIISWIAHACGLLGTIFLAGLMLMTVADVVLRYFFNAPILGSFEITEYLLVVIVFFALPWAALKRVNVRVDLIVGKFTPKRRAKFDAVTCAFSMIVTGFFAWYTVPQTIYVYRLYTVSDMLEIPSWPFYFMVAFGFFLLFLVLIETFIDFLKKAVGE